MSRKTLISFLLFMLLLTCSAFAKEYDPSLEELTSPLNSLCGVNVASPLDSVRQLFEKEPSKIWQPPSWAKNANKETQYGLNYDYIQNKDPKVGYTVQRELTIASDLDRKVNALSYVLYYRSSEDAQTTLSTLISNASAAYGTPQEIFSLISGKKVLHRIWIVGDMQLTIVQYDMPGYKPGYPHTVRIMRSYQPVQQ